MEFKNETRPERVVDETTGVELFEKYHKERMKSALSDVPDWNDIIFVFRDPAYVSASGSRDIEFYAHVLRKKDGPTLRTGQFLPRGYEIDSDEIAEVFAEYCSSGSKNIAEIELYLSEMLKFRMPMSEINVEFKKGVNNPRRKYDLIGGLLQTLAKPKVS